MRKVYYDEGPERLTAGVAGVFQKGVPKEVSEEIAAALLAKPLFKEAVEKPVVEDAEEVKTSAAPTFKPYKK